MYLPATCVTSGLDRCPPPRRWTA